MVCRGTGGKLPKQNKETGDQTKKGSKKIYSGRLQETCRKFRQERKAEWAAQSQISQAGEEGFMI